MKISVIICTYNRGKFINSCLELLNKQTLNKDLFEVIVINNNCTDRTEYIVDEFILKNPVLNIRQVFEKNQGLSFARNRGIKESNYDIITYIDDDGDAHHELLYNIHIFFQENKNAVGVGGKVIPKYETEEPEWLSYHTRMMVTHIDYGKKCFKCYGKKYPPGCNMSYLKHILLKTNGFNESLKWRVDDKHIFYSVRKISDQIFYNPDLIVFHNIDEYRVSDKSFKILGLRLGEEEKLRTLDLSIFAYLSKIINYTLILVASTIFLIKYTLKKQFIKGKYLVWFRWLALKGLVK